MLSATLRTDIDCELWRHKHEPIAPGDHSGGFILALSSGGDSRLAADPNTGLNKYLCPAVPARPQTRSCARPALMPC